MSEFALDPQGNCPDCGEAPDSPDPRNTDGDPCSHPCHDEAAAELEEGER